MKVTPKIPDGWFPIARRLAEPPDKKYLTIEDAWLDEEYRIDEAPIHIFDAYTFQRRGILTLCNHKGSELINGNQITCRYLIGKFNNRRFIP